MEVSTTFFILFKTLTIKIYICTAPLDFDSYVFI